jgi:2-iminobutanoate/2-iminopropanoate deaminase
MELVNPPQIGAPAAAYSHGVTAGDLVFVAGQVALGPDGQVVAPGDLAAQTRFVISNIEIILKAAGASLKDVVSTTVYLTSFEGYAEYNVAYVEAFGGHKPARATLRADLFKPDLLIEIQAIAVRGPG